MWIIIHPTIILPALFLICVTGVCWSPRTHRAAGSTPWTDYHTQTLFTLPPRVTLNSPIVLNMQTPQKNGTWSNWELNPCREATVLSTQQPIFCELLELLNCNSDREQIVDAPDCDYAVSWYQLLVIKHMFMLSGSSPGCSKSNCSIWSTSGWSRSNYLDAFLCLPEYFHFNLC